MYNFLKQKLSQQVIIPDIGVEVISTVVSRKKMGIKYVYKIYTSLYNYIFVIKHMFPLISQFWF